MCSNIKLKPIISLNLIAVPLATMRGETNKEAVLPGFCEKAGGGKLVMWSPLQPSYPPKIYHGGPEEYMKDFIPNGYMFFNLNVKHKTPILKVIKC